MSQLDSISAGSLPGVMPTIVWPRPLRQVSFCRGVRQWETRVSLSENGNHALTIRCTDLAGDVQPDEPNWNNSGSMRNVIETVQVNAI